RGWVHAIDLAPIAERVRPMPIRGEDALRLLLPLADGEPRFDDGAAARKRGACTPFHPAAPVRAARLLSFLYAVGALRFQPAPAPASVYRMLELPEGATVDEVKRAYRRLARELHPDRHPSAAPEDLRDLERRFAEVSAAYRRLV